MTNNTHKKDFPILSREVEGKSLVYLDNAATSQKPKQVIEAISNYYLNNNANVHRGIHMLSEEATQMYEDARKRVADFIGAAVPQEIVFTRGTTESLNLAARAWGTKNLSKGDVILTTISEHHSSFLPWQAIAEEKEAIVDFIYVTKDGELDYEDFNKKLNKYGEKLKVLAISEASNVLGTIFDIKKICRLVKQKNEKIVVVIDGAQSTPHIKVNVQSLGCDFFAFSGHKMLAPTGIGVLWINRNLFDDLVPYQVGGGMIKAVTQESAIWAKVPEMFEAGTPNIAGAVGLAAALDYLDEIGMENMRKHEVELNTYAFEKLTEIDGLNIIGPSSPEERTGLFSFTVDGIHSHDIASVLNSYGVAVRSGHHCAMPLHTWLQIVSTARASFYIYNTKEDIDALVGALLKAKEILL